MKKIILIVLLISGICSCGSKKKTFDRQKEEAAFSEKKDVDTNIKNDITSNVLTTKKGIKTTIEPKDPTKESHYNGIPFKNAKITEEETEEETESALQDNSEINLSDNSESDFKSDKQSKKLDLDKDTSFNVFDWLWLFLAIAIVLFIIRLYLKKINPITWLKNRVVK